MSKRSYVGMDVHLNSIVAVWQRAGGERHKLVVERTEEGFDRLVEAVEGTEIWAAYEASSCGWEAHDELTRRGWKVFVLAPTHLPKSVRGRKRKIGPSSATVGDGVVYVGNRADSTVCAVDARSLVRGACGRLDSMPDGLAYVAPTRELWVTTPRDKSVRILDGATLSQKAKLGFDGQPEGFAVDAARGRFYTNLEDKDRTLAIDLKSHQTVATWNPKCGEEGPHGLRIDEKGGLLFVACSARTEALDAGHDGAVLSSVDTGDGVDDLDYAPARHLLYVGAARAGKLTVARVDGRGKLTVVAQVPTREGARNGVVVKDGTVYLAHASTPKSNDLLVVSPTTK